MRACCSRSARPTEVYAHPANLFVAQFVGSPVMNVANAAVSAGEGHGAPSPSRAPPRASPSRPSCSASSNGKRRQASCRSASGRKACSSRSEAADGFLPVEAHIIEPLGSYDIVDLKFGSQMLRARTRSRLRRQGRRPGLRPHRSRRRRISSTRQAAQSLGVQTLMAHIQLKNVTKKFGNHTALRGPRPRHRRRRVLRAARRDRRRQDDDAAPDRRPREADRGPGLHRRRRRRRLGRGRARRGAGAAAIFALPALHGARRTSNSR